MKRCLFLYDVIGHRKALRFAGTPGDLRDVVARLRSYQRMASALSAELFVSLPWREAEKAGFGGESAAWAEPVGDVPRALVSDRDGKLPAPYAAPKARASGPFRPEFIFEGEDILIADGLDEDGDMRIRLPFAEFCDTLLYMADKAEQDAKS